MTRIHVASLAIASLGIACAATEGSVAVQASQAAPAAAQNRYIGVKEGDIAPEITAKTSDGKEATLASLTKEGPVILMFIKKTCGANPSAAPLVNKVHDAYGKSARLVGVINADAAGDSEWKQEFKGQFVTLLDPEKKIINAYGIKKSYIGVMVGQDGKVAKLFPGWGQASLTSLSDELAKASKLEAKKVDVSAAPAGTAYG